MIEIDISPFEEIAKTLDVPIENLIDINLRDLSELAYKNGIELKFSLIPKEENNIAQSWLETPYPQW